jgi:GntR family transcriptional regulator
VRAHSSKLGIALPSSPQLGRRCRRSALPSVDDVSEPPVFDADSPTPVYVQVADYLTAQIASGERQPGSRLPAERDLARDLGVAYDTVRRATALMRERRLITTVHGKGTYVVKPQN